MRLRRTLFATAATLVLFAPSAYALSLGQIRQQNTTPVPNPDGYTAQQLLGLPAPAMGAGSTVGGKIIMPLDGSLPMTGPLKAPQASVAGPANTLVFPQGNAYPTFSALSAQTNAVMPYGTTQTYPFTDGNGNVTQRVTGREYMVSLGMVDAVGGYSAPLGSPASLNDPTDKVVLYAGMDCRQGGAPCWTINTSMNIASGFAALGHGATGYELDMNNNDVDSGGGDGLGGMVEPGYYGLNITGAGKYAITAAIGIGGPGTHAIYHRGIVDSGNAVDQCLICEYGNAYKVIDARGTGQSVLDSSKGNYSTPINIGYGQTLTATKADGSAGLQWLGIGTDGSLTIAPIGASSVAFGGQVSPRIANQQVLTSARSGDSNIAQLIGLGGDNFLNIGALNVAGLRFGSNLSPQISNGQFFTALNPSGAIEQLVGVGADNRGKLMPNTNVAGLDVGVPMALAAGLAAPNLPTAGGTAKGSACVDTNGNFYVKTTSGACL